VLGVINHGVNMRGNVSTNTIEGVFSVSTRGMTGTYAHRRLPAPRSLSAQELRTIREWVDAAQRHRSQAISREDKSSFEINKLTHK